MLLEPLKNWRRIKKLERHTHAVYPGQPLLFHHLYGILPDLEFLQKKALIPFGLSALVLVII